MNLYSPARLALDVEDAPGGVAHVEHARLGVVGDVGVVHVGGQGEVEALEPGLAGIEGHDVHGLGRTGLEGEILGVQERVPVADPEPDGARRAALPLARPVHDAQPRAGVDAGRARARQRHVGELDVGVVGHGAHADGVHRHAGRGEPRPPVGIDAADVVGAVRQQHGRRERRVADVAQHVTEGPGDRAARAWRRQIVHAAQAFDVERLLTDGDDAAGEALVLQELLLGQRRDHGLAPGRGAVRARVANVHARRRVDEPGDGVLPRPRAFELERRTPQHRQRDGGREQLQRSERDASAGPDRRAPQRDEDRDGGDGHGDAERGRAPATGEHELRLAPDGQRFLEQELEHRGYRPASSGSSRRRRS